MSAERPLLLACARVPEDILFSRTAFGSVGILTPVPDSPEEMSLPPGEPRLPESLAWKTCVDADGPGTIDLEAISGLDQVGKLLARAGPEGGWLDGEDIAVPNRELEGPCTFCPSKETS